MVKLSENSEMRDRKLLTIDNEDIKGEDYRLLIEVALDKCNRFAFVQRRDLMENENVAMEHFYKLVENNFDKLIEYLRNA